MTDKELQELKSQLENIRKEHRLLSFDEIKRKNELSAIMREISNEIFEENVQRIINGGMPEFKRLVLDELDKRQSTKSSQLWMIKINGKVFQNQKGKKTWTSEGRARRAISNYLEYNYGSHRELDAAIVRSQKNKMEVVDELIKDGSVEIIRIY